MGSASSRKIRRPIKRCNHVENEGYKSESALNNASTPSRSFVALPNAGASNLRLPNLIPVSHCNFPSANRFSLPLGVGHSRQPSRLRPSPETPFARPLILRLIALFSGKRLSKVSLEAFIAVVRFVWWAWPRDSCCQSGAEEELAVHVE